VRSFRLSSFSRVTCRNNFAHTFPAFGLEVAPGIEFTVCAGCENLRIPIARNCAQSRPTNDEIFMGTCFSYDACEDDESRLDRRSGAGRNRFLNPGGAHARRGGIGLFFTAARNVSTRTAAFSLAERASKQVTTAEPWSLEKASLSPIP